MKNTILKNTLKEMRKTGSRFLSIFGILAIGTGFFTGITASAPDMRLSADEFFDEQNLMDYRLVSTLGFSDKDIEALEQLDNIEVYPSYFTDSYIKTEGSEDDKVVRIYALDSLCENNEHSSLVLTEGRFPENPDECIVDAGKLVSAFKIGGTVSLFSGSDDDISDTLENTEYKIVGKFKSPMFISDTEKGNASIGNGSVSLLMYVPSENFKTEVYTQLFLTSTELDDMICYSSEYEDKAAEIKKKIEKTAKTREKQRYEELTAEPRQELDDAQKELDAKREDAEKQFEEAQKQIDDAKAELEEKKKETEEQLEKAEKKYADSFSEYTEKKADAYKQLDDAEAEIEENQSKLDKEKADAEKEFEEAQKKIDESRAVLDDARVQLALGKIQLDSANKELESAEEKLTSAKALLTVAEKTYDALKDHLASDPELAEQIEKDIAEYRQSYEDAKKEYDAGKAQYDNAVYEYYQKETQYNNAENQYNNGINELSQNKISAQQMFASAQTQIESAKAVLVSKRADVEEQFSQAEKTLASSREEIDSQKELADKEFDKAEKQIADSQKELDEKKADAEKQMSEAQEKIDDGISELIKVSTPKWYVFDRNDNPAYEEFGQNADRIANIALVFPMFFIMVAILVCLTTMTRMVEEHRTQSGTLKAMGFSSAAIMSEYLIYALTAAILGSVAGSLFGMKFFPLVIIIAYGMMYYLPHMLMPYDILLMIVTTLVSALLVTVTVYCSCRSIINEQPANLMRPKTPRAGKKIMLERIGFFWKHLSFSLKVSLRNIFRYKRRMLMTIIGISGCTALVLTGFGLYDSISDILYKQFDEISLYTGMALYDDISDEDLARISDILSENGFEGDNIFQKQIDVKSAGGSSTCNIMVSENNEVLEKYYFLKDRHTKEHYILDDDGVIIDEKLAQLLGDVKKGDAVEISLTDSKTISVTVKEICENYAYHYLYMTRTLYEELTEESLNCNTFIFNSSDDSFDDENEALRDEISSRLIEVDGVMAVSFKYAVEGVFNRMMNSLLSVIVVLILSAGALALIVLYNLTNININERIREIATLKVLGQYDREVSLYVFRETIFLTLLGTGAGILLGRLLLDFVVRTAEIDLVMFGRDVHPLSYIFAVAITLVFAVIVMLMMHKKLADINMVEALKSIE